MVITNEDIDFVQKAFKIFQTPGHYPDGKKSIDIYKKVYAEEINNKQKPYYRSLSPGCGSCIRHCIFTMKNSLTELGILDLNGDFVK